MPESGALDPQPDQTGDWGPRARALTVYWPPHARARRATGAPRLQCPVSARLPPRPTRTPGRPRLQRRPGLAHAGRVARVRHGRSWPRRSRLPLRWRPPEATVLAVSGRRGRRRMPPGPVGRQSPLARACWAWLVACRPRARRPLPPPRVAWSKAAGISGAGKGPSAPPWSPRRAGRAPRTRLRGARCLPPHPAKWDSRCVSGRRPMSPSLRV